MWCTTIPLTQRAPTLSARFRAISSVIKLMEVCAMLRDAAMKRLLNVRWCASLWWRVWSIGWKNTTLMDSALTLWGFTTLKLCARFVRQRKKLTPKCWFTEKVGRLELLHCLPAMQRWKQRCIACLELQLLVTNCVMRCVVLSVMTNSRLCLLAC